jgi:hypothetical protein
MIVKAKETILKDGGYICEIQLSRDPEESAGEWENRRQTLINSTPNLIFGASDDSGLTLRLQLIPGAEENEFNPDKLTEAELLRELGAIDSKNTGRVHRNDVLDPIYEE